MTQFKGALIHVLIGVDYNRGDIPRRTFSDKQEINTMTESLEYCAGYGAYLLGWDKSDNPFYHDSFTSENGRRKYTDWDQGWEYGEDLHLDHIEEQDQSYYRE